MFLIILSRGCVNKFVTFGIFRLLTWTVTLRSKQLEKSTTWCWSVGDWSEYRGNDKHIIWPLRYAFEWLLGHRLLVIMRQLCRSVWRRLTRQWNCLKVRCRYGEMYSIELRFALSSTMFCRYCLQWLFPLPNLRDNSAAKDFVSMPESSLKQIPVGLEETLHEVYGG